MRKFITLFLAFTALVATARHIAPDEAASVAESFLNRSVAGASQKTPRRALAVGDAQKPFYAFNAEDGQGFVLVSADDRAPRILGYADSGSLDMTNLPPQLAALLDSCAVNIEQLPDVTHVSWKAPARAEGENKVLPTANWGQGYPYNLLTPEIEGQHSPTGCVATAMAIIMKYNEWPQQARGGIHKWGSYMSYNFDEASFDFDKILSDYTEGTYTDEEAFEVSKLMQAAGAASCTAYGAQESGANVCIVGHYMHEFFSFSPQSQYINSMNFDKEEWFEMMREQIDNNHPFILSGFGETGHAFLCDGYDADGLLHINWGWDGMDNGYFDSTLLGGFSNNVGMTINLFNDGNTRQYSRAWIDPGYLWNTQNGSKGTNTNVENIEKDAPFKIVFSQPNFPGDFGGSLGVALMDKNDEIIEVITGEDRYFGGNCICWSGPFAMRNVVFTSEIEPDMRVQLVTKEVGHDWLPVLGTIEAPSFISVNNNIPYISKINWAFIDPDNVIQGFEYQNYNQYDVLMGDGCPFRVSKIKGGVVYLFVDGEYWGNSSDFEDLAGNFMTSKDCHNIELHANGYHRLIDKSVILETPGSLSTLIPEEECPLIFRLKIEGEMNIDDFDFITFKLYSLQHLDIENTTIAESPRNRKNFTPPYAGYIKGSYVWGLHTLRLPKSLEGFETFGLPYKWLEFLEIPETVSFVGDFALYGYDNCSLDFIKVNNPIPPRIDYDPNYSNSDQRKFITLIVPSGCKAAYEAVPGWNAFKEIVETDTPFVGGYVDLDGFRYDIITDFASVRGKATEKEDCLILPKAIEYNGEFYPVEAFSKYFRVERLYLDQVDSFDLNHGWGSPADNIYTNRLYPNLISRPQPIEEFAGYYLWVPGGAEKFYESTWKRETVAMYSYEIDKVNRLLSIRPHVNTKIEKIVIDGETLTLNDEGLYHFIDPTTLNVEVTYSVNDGEHMMTTVYPAEFNQNMGSSDLSTKAETVTIEAEGSTKLSKDETVQLRATVLPETTTDKTVVWSSSDEEIASVSDSGLVSAQTKEGNVTIYATCGEAVGSIEISVSTWTGVDNILVDNGNSFEVYTVSGLKINSGCNQSVLQKLPAGIYIIRQGNAVMKHIVK